MSSPANTSISFQPTDTAVNDKRQTNLTSVGKNPLLCKHEHSNQDYKRQCNRCNAATATTPCISCQKCISTEGEESNDAPFKR